MERALQKEEEVEAATSSGPQRNSAEEPIRKEEITSQGSRRSAGAFYFANVLLIGPFFSLSPFTPSLARSNP